MHKKCVCLISLVFLLGMVGNVLAVDRDWTNGGGTRLWRTASNWSGNAVPTSADKAAIRNASVLGPIIDSSTTAVAAQVVLGDWSSTNDTLDMTGGSLTTTSWFVLGYGPTTNHGTFNISGGTVNCPSTLYVGNTGTAIGTLNMSGGTITATTFGIAQVAGSTGNVYLDGGTISCGTFSITTSGGRMDITQGTLIVNGDVTSTINGYISSGWLTAFGGSGTLNVDYNIRNPGKTTVTAQSPEKASYPSPANGATGISINADLSWIAGIYATSHDVYFGTASPGTFRGNQTAVTFDPGTLALNTTYYWRIDEVNSTNPASPWIGDVWSFTTQTGTATLKKGPYLIYPGNNAQMTVLWQLSASETCSIAWGTDTSYSTGSANVPVYGTDYQYKYNITSLAPGTKYYYKVTVGAGIATGSFQAAPSASATNVKFFMYGDTRTNAGSNNTCASRMVSLYTADPAVQTIVLHAGDWVNADAEADWTSQWFTNNSTTTQLYELMRNVAITGCSGNHEGGVAPVYSKYWPQPYVANHYYSFDYGPVHVAVIDMYNSYTSGSAQYNWLVSDLSASTKPWKIMVFHEPAWNAGGSHGNNATAQATFQPLAQTYNVQICLAGHNHFYSRCAVPLSGSHIIQHITHGAGGAPFYTYDAGQPYVVAGIGNTLVVGEVVIDGNTLTHTAYRADNGNVVDTVILTLDGALPLPGQATSPSPANGATDVATNATLSWTAGSDATSHDVYFGTTSPGTFQGNQTATTFNPGTLALSTTYYWRIDEKNATGTTTGVVWSFTTTSTVAAPTFVAAGAVSSGTGAITPALPSGIAANDILLLFLETANEAISISNQNGGTWTAVTNSPQGTGTAGGTSATRLTVFWSRYNGTQGAPTASDSGNHQIGRMIAVRGAVTSGNPWDVTAGGVEATADTSGSISGATTTVGNTLVVAAIATSLPDASGTTNFSAWANSNLTSVTECIDNTMNSGNGGGLGIATGVKATAGAYGDTTVTAATSAVKGMMSIAIKP